MNLSLAGQDNKDHHWWFARQLMFFYLIAAFRKSTGALLLILHNPPLYLRCKNSSHRPSQINDQQSRIVYSVDTKRSSSNTFKMPFFEIRLFRWLVLARTAKQAACRAADSHTAAGMLTPMPLNGSNWVPLLQNTDQFKRLDASKRFEKIRKSAAKNHELSTGRHPHTTRRVQVLPVSGMFSRRESLR